MSIVNGIVKDNLCIGCGLCESVYGQKNAKMQLNQNGFFYPVVENFSKEKDEIIGRICPGKNIINDLDFSKEQSVWGKALQYYSGYSLENAVRTKGSSGGIVSGIAIFLLEQKIVNGVLQVGGYSDDFERNELKVSKTKDDVLSCASSRYAPALIFNKIHDILQADKNVYAFIGKPCDISALKNFLTEYPQFRERFSLTVSIMCAGMPSFKGTKALVDEFNPEFPVTDLVYRGNGWPGFFSFKDKLNIEYKKSYNDSWGKTLNKHLNFRCKICPDGIGLQADIAVGDAWETKDGYPDFTEREGQSLLIVRTQQGLNVLNQAVANNKMYFAILAEEKIALMQPFQYSRRTRLGARLLALFVGKQRMVVNYKNLGLVYNMKKVPVRFLVKEFLGTLKRVVTLNNNNI